MNRFLHLSRSPGFSAGEARQMIIVFLLLISAGVGVWTYWPQIEGFISPGPKSFPQPAAAVAPASAPAAATPAPAPGASPKLRTAAPKLGVQEVAVAAKAGDGKQLPFNLVEEAAAPEEPEGNLPEKLNTIKILEGDEIKRIEKQLVARQKRDDESVIQDYLQSSRISGVRVAGPMSKLLLNGQVYQVGDTVRESPKVVIRKITTAQVIFQDQTGKQYPVKY